MTIPTGKLDVRPDIRLISCCRDAAGHELQRSGARTDHRSERLRHDLASIRIPQEIYRWVRGPSVLSHAVSSSDTACAVAIVEFLISCHQIFVASEQMPSSCLYPGFDRFRNSRAMLVHSTIQTGGKFYEALGFLLGPRRI